MGEPNLVNQASWLKDIGVPILTFILGLLTRFTLSRKEWLDFKHARQKRGEELSAAINKAFGEFTKALTTYLHSQSDAQGSEPSIDQFIAIAVTGEEYFMRLKAAVDAAFDGSLTPVFISSTLVPAIKDAHERNIPKFYQVLSDIQKRRGFKYEGFRRENYDLIVSFYEKHCLADGIAFPQKRQKTK